jgi:hypothetical protein
LSLRRNATRLLCLLRVELILASSLSQLLQRTERLITNGALARGVESLLIISRANAHKSA